MALLGSRKDLYVVEFCEIFAEAEKQINAFVPDVVILDLKQDGGFRPEYTGNETMGFIWNSRFCPVIIYSAFPEALASGDWGNHPFVKIVKKGKDSEKAVETELKNLNNHIEALNVTQKHIQNSLNMQVKEVAPQVFAQETDPEKQKDGVLRSARRRLAASMDTPEGNLASWEGYIYPPFPEQIYLGDLLQLKGTPNDNPSNFRLVLTASCDLVTGHSKVKKVLVAECVTVKVGVDKILAKLQLCGTDRGWLLEKLNKLVLSQGYYMEYVPMPKLTNKIPLMWVDLKKLNLIPIENIGPEKDYIRIASLDNPFRNFISWAYLQSACRPGLPDRDFISWRDEIKSEDAR